MTKKAKEPKTSEVKGSNIVSKDGMKITKIDVLSLIKRELKKDQYHVSPEPSKDPPKELLILKTIQRVLAVAKKLKFGLVKMDNSCYVYNGEYWELIEKDDLSKFLGECAYIIGITPFHSQYFDFRNLLYKQFRSAAHKSSPVLSKDVVRINLLNGTFVISGKSAKLKKFDPNDFMTYQLPFEFNKKAKSPIFDTFINRVLPDKEKQDVLAEFLGSIFIRNGGTILKEEKALMLFGAGANGKSVLYEVINALLGNQNVSSYTLQSLTNENGYYRAKIGDKLVNYSSEINSKIEASLFKQLASGEPVEARLPYFPPFIMTQYAKLIFNTNQLPKSVEHTNAFFRRFIIIEFDVTIPENEQDKRLHLKIIQNELPGVFNWMLKGLDRLIRQGRFTDSKSIKDAVNQYKSQSDNVSLFIEDEKYHKSSEDSLLLSNVYPEYKKYCLENGYHPLNKSNFNKRIEAIGIKTKRKNYGNVIYITRKQPDNSTPF